MSSVNTSSANLPDSTGRSFSTNFSSQSASAPGFHHSASIQGLNTIHGSFNVPNMSGSLVSRNLALGGAAASGVQQPTGSISSGRFSSNNLPAVSQLTHGHTGVNNRGLNVVGGPSFSSNLNVVGGAMPGINPNSGTVTNRSAIPGLGVSPILGNAGPRITSSIGNIIGGNSGRNIGSGSLTIPGLSSRMNLSANTGSNNISIQGANRLKSGVLQQAPQMMGIIGSSYSGSGGPLSQGQVQAGNSSLSSMAMLNDLGSNDNSPFDPNDFPQLTGRPSSAGGPQGQLVSLRKQGMGVNSIVQQNQEFSIQNEDFPALPGYKGGANDFTADLHQKDQIHENVSLMQSQFNMARSGGGFSLGAYPSHRQQQQQHAPYSLVDFASPSSQDIHLHSADIFAGSHGPYHSQGGGPPSIGLRPLNSPNPGGAVGTYNQLVQQYQSSNQAQFRVQQMPGQAYRDQNPKSLQGNQAVPDKFGLMGILNVIRFNESDLASLALGIDLTTLGLNLTSPDIIYKTFSSPWSEEPAKGEPEFSVPGCYFAKPPPSLQQSHFSKFQLDTLFYIFYSMPKDEAQLYAALELCRREWFYHKELRQWFMRVQNVEPVKTNTYERGCYLFFDPNKWESVRKDNFVLHYDLVEKKPTLPVPQH